jgi:cytochrome d ubiquinol oxidase subunit II
VGILLPFLGKKDEERRAIINAIGPFWDGNEVWLITAGGALFASFPQVYATLFSGFYLALFLILLGLIVRGVSFEIRSKLESSSWRNFWDWMNFLGSFLSALLWGVAVANLIRGVPIDEKMYYHGGLLGLISIFTLIGGITFVLLFAYHGANFLALKLADEMASRAQSMAKKLSIWTIVFAVIFILWSLFGTPYFLKGAVPWLAVLAAILAAISLLLSTFFAFKEKSGSAFFWSALTIVFAVVMVFSGLYPRIMISTLNPEWSLTIANASASQYTLKTMFIVALILVPIVLLYQIWTYRVFRERISPSKKLEY